MWAAFSPNYVNMEIFSKNDLIRSEASDQIASSVSCISATTRPRRLVHSYCDRLIDKATAENGFLALLHIMIDGTICKNVVVSGMP